MGWTTLYITGKNDFREEVREKLDDSDVDVMQGYTGMYDVNGETHELYWMDDQANLRSIKEAIGSKLIWKYRLNFYPSFEAFIETQDKKNARTQLTDEDFAFIEEMKAAVR